MRLKSYLQNKIKSWQAVNFSLIEFTFNLSSSVYLHQIQEVGYDHLSNKSKVESKPVKELTNAYKFALLFGIKL